MWDLYNEPGNSNMGDKSLPLVEAVFTWARAEKPTRIIEDAIAGMLPKNKLGKQMFRKLNVYAGDQHPHAAQQPVALTIK